MNKRFTKLIAALALLVFMTPSLAGWGQTREDVTLQYTGSTTQNMTGGNDAALVGLTDTDWSVVGAKGGSSNFPGLNKDGDIRLYYAASGSNTITVTNNSGNTISSIAITYTGNNYSNGKVFVDDTEVTASNGLYAINATSFVVTNGNTSNVQVRISKIVMTLDGGTPTPTCATPTFSLEAGTYSEAQTVSITCETEGATVYYTTDGENPTASSSVYSAPLTIEQTTTVKAIAMKEGYNNSAVATAVYTIAQEQTFNKIAGHNPVAGQIYLIVDLTSGRALTSANGTSSAPTAVAVTINDNDQITTAESALQWTFEAVEGGYVIHPVGDDTKWLYTTNSSGNSVRVGDGTNKAWTLDVMGTETQGYHGFKNNGSSFYLGVYNNQDWRGYSSINNNIQNTQIALFVLGEAPTDPVISASNVSIEYDATEGEITYAVENPVDDATVVATTTAEWLTIGTIGETVPFTCSANTETSARTATVTLNYVKNGETLATKDVTVTQAAAPVVYTTIPALFDAATSTSTPVTVNFGGWVVTGVNGSQSFVTDGTNGFIMYQSSHGFVVGNTLSGTVNCNLVLFNGSAEITGLTTTTEGLTVGENGSVTPVITTIDNLAAVNTGSVVTLNTLTYDGTVLSDGNNTISPYTSLYHEASFENGKTYNITGVFVQNNSAKRILPRSAEDIEEVVVTEPSITVSPSEITVNAEYHQDVLTVTYENLDPTSSNPVAIFYDAEGHETNCSWLWVELQSDRNFRYTIFTNEGEARTAYFKIRCNGVYSDMVTVNQAAYVAPPTPGNWVLTSIDELTEDDVFVIVGDNGDTYAMSNNNGTSSAPAAVSVAVVDNTLSDEIGDNLQWNISRTDDGYIFYPNGTTETWLYCTNTNNGVRVGVNEGNVFIIEDGYLKNVTTERYVGIYNSQDWRCYKLGSDGSFPANIADQTFAFYKKVEEESYDLTITGYTNDNEKTGYHLIASPVTFDPNGTDMTLGDFDLYYFDQEGDSEGNEWMNWESNHFSLVPGTGYLYAKKATPEAQTYYFTLSGNPYNESGSIPLTYNSTAQFAGWNLIGNPFGEDATLDMPFYRMNGEGSGLEAVEETNSTVYAMEGVFVNAFDQDYGVLSYANFTRAGNTSGEGGMKINLTRNRGTVIDNAIVRFDNGRQLPKFQLNPENTKLYIAQGEKDYAIVRSAAQGEMPVSFRAAENGTYTLSIETENVEMDYLHLIDNMTGMDVDLLANPNYTFEAKTSDYASRFRLVFSANGIDEQNAETFAFFNGSEWVVSNTGEATLQVVDVMGRVLSTETISGNAELSLDQPAGVYMLRLINGNDVKVQKVIVK